MADLFFAGWTDTDYSNPIIVIVAVIFWGWIFIKAAPKFIKGGNTIAGGGCGGGGCGGGCGG